MAMIRAEQVTFEVDGKRLIQDISFDLGPGTVLGVVGPNGAGKSTLLKCLAGELHPTCGGVLWDGQPLASLPRTEVARRRGILPQANRLPFAFTVREVVLLGRSPHVLGRETHRDHEIVAKALDVTDARHLADRSVQTLSGGELQRVHMARVLAQIWDPCQRGRLLLLDEPTAALDLKHQHALLRLACQWAGRDCAVLVILHDIGQAARYCDTLLWLQEGHCAALGSPGETVTAERIRDIFEVDALVEQTAPDQLRIDIRG